MVVAIDEARHDDMLDQSPKRLRLVLRRQFAKGTDVDDRAVALEHGAV